MSKHVGFNDFYNLKALHVILRAKENEHDPFLASLDSVLWTNVPGASYALLQAQRAEPNGKKLLQQNYMTHPLLLLKHI